jgi:pentatricopeptide repeat protein
MSACEKSGQWQKVLSLLESMPGFDLKPDHITMSIAIRACERGGQWDKSAELQNSLARLSPRNASVSDRASPSGLKSSAQLLRQDQAERAIIENAPKSEPVENKSPTRAFDDNSLVALRQEVLLAFGESVNSNDSNRLEKRRRAAAMASVREAAVATQPKDVAARIALDLILEEMPEQNENVSVLRALVVHLMRPSAYLDSHEAFDFFTDLIRQRARALGLRL